MIDVRDLAEWIVFQCERGRNGTFNATHPGVAWGTFLDACRSASGSDASVTWVTDEFLVAQEVGEWIELPLWLADPAFAAADDVDVSHALAAGLSFRPLEDTVRATLDRAPTIDGVGLAPDREAALLRAWHGR